MQQSVASDNLKGEEIYFWGKRTNLGDTPRQHTHHK